jgi:hypothetical protein
MSGSLLYTPLSLLRCDDCYQFLGALSVLWTSAAGGLARLLLQREPLAHMLDVLEGEKADLHAGQTKATRGEVLQCAHRSL